MRSFSRPTRRFAVSFAFGLLLFLVEKATAVSGAQILRVAISDFTVDDPSCRSGMAARNFSSALQGELAKLENVEWVEREQLDLARKELNLAVGGLIPTSSALRVGRWVKADILILGRFEPDEKVGWRLRLELVDLAFADVLKETSIDITDFGKGPIRIESKDIEAAATALGSAFADAREVLKRTSGQIVVAPLFFSNTDPTRRLDFLEPDIIADIGRAMNATQTARVIRFPRASQSTEEAELVLNGLVESGTGTWQKVADIYLWGSYTEENAPGASFEKTPVRCTLSISDGGQDILSFTETSTVGTVANLKARLCSHVVESVRGFKPRPVSDASRQNVALALGRRSYELETPLRNSPTLVTTAEGRRLHQSQLTHLATARFFDPNSPLISRKWLMRWQPNTFWGCWEKIRKCNDHLGKFGVINSDGTHAELSNLLFPVPGMDHGPWPLQSVDSDMVNQFLDSVSRVLGSIEATHMLPEENRFQIFSQGMKIPMESLPKDVSRDMLQSWRGQLERMYGQKLIQIAESIRPLPPDLRYVPNFGHRLSGAYNIEDVQLRARVIEAMWPFLLEAYQRPGGKLKMSSEELAVYFGPVFKRVNETFAAVGKPETGRKLEREFRSLLVDTGPLPKPVPTPSSNLVVVDLLPPRLEPKSKFVLFPVKPAVDGVIALCHAAGQLWVSTKAGAIPEDAFGFTFYEFGYKFLPSEQATLWCHDPRSGTNRSVSDGLEKHSKITSLLAHGDRVWMTLREHGVWNIDPRSPAVQRFGSKEGVPSTEMYASTAIDGSLVFGGGDPAEGRLGMFEVRSSSWKKLEPQGVAPPSQIEVLAAFKQHLLVEGRDSNRHKVKSVQVVDCDWKTGKWRDVHSTIFKDARPKMPRLEHETVEHPVILAAVADESGIWLGTSQGMILYNPETDKVQTWFSPQQGFQISPEHPEELLAKFQNGAIMTDKPGVRVSRVPGTVTAFAVDGEFLWLGTAWEIETIRNFGALSQGWTWRDKNERNHILLFHRPSRRWVGYFPVPTRVTSLAVSDRVLWVGFEKSNYLEFTGDHTTSCQSKQLPSPLLSVEKQPLLSIPQSQWISDEFTEQEIKRQVELAVK